MITQQRYFIIIGLLFSLLSCQQTEQASNSNAIEGFQKVVSDSLWEKHFEDCHLLVALTWHPAEDGDLAEAKRNVPELHEKTVKLYQAQLPSTYQNFEKPITDLYKSVEKLNTDWNTISKDSVSLVESLKLIHDQMHVLTRLKSGS